MEGTQVTASGGETRRAPFSRAGGARHHAGRIAMRVAMRVAARVASAVLFWPRVLAASAGFGLAVVAGALLSLARRDRTRVASDIGAMIGRLTLPALGIRLDLSHPERLAATQPCVYVANHQSFIDYPVQGSVFPPRTVVLGRADLGRMPLIGWLYRATGNLLVDRGDPASRRAALEAMIRAVRGGTSLWIFAEGTRNAGPPGTLLPFRRGAFHVAVTVGVPIVPVVVEPLAPRTALRARRLERRVVRVQVLAPVYPAGRDADAMVGEVRARMQGALGTPPARPGA